MNLNVDQTQAPMKNDEPVKIGTGKELESHL